MTVTTHRTLPGIGLDPQFLERHHLQGWVPGAAGGIAGESAAIDREIAEEPCDRCGTPRRYFPFVHGRYGSDYRRGGGYRAFAVCPTCGLEDEF